MIYNFKLIFLYLIIVLISHLTKNLKKISTTIGPGSYTSLRVGAAFISGLNISKEIQFSLILEFRILATNSLSFFPIIKTKILLFMVSDIGHSVSTSGWETEITGLMIADMPTFWERSGKLKNPPPNNFLDLFTITNVEDVETARENLSIELFDGLEEGEEPLVKKAYDKVRNDIEEETAFFNGDYGKWRDFLFGGSQNVKRRSFNRIVNLYEEKLNNAWVEYRNFLTRFAASELKIEGQMITQSKENLQ